MCITSSACALKLSQLSPLRQKCCWNGAPHPPGLGLTAQRGLVLTPAHQPMPKTRHRGQRTSCGVLLHYPFSKLLPDKEALVRGKPKQHFWPRELYVTVPSEQTISNSCWEKPVLQQGRRQSLRGDPWFSSAHWDDVLPLQYSGAH